MQISADRLKKIIIEEYIKEELLDESQAAQDLLRQILGDEEYERRQALKNRGSRGGDTAPMEKPNKAADTMSMDIPKDNEPERSTAPLEDRLMDLIQGLPAEEVAELFQSVFEKIPGVEMQDEEPPQTLYTPGAEGRPQMGFKLEELQELIRRVFRDV
tara:strand:- start:519 stop:992 length:474 start_codon:yes stop_codon:yes gene_type:complete